MIILFSASQILQNARIHFCLTLTYPHPIHIISAEAENSFFPGMYIISSQIRCVNTWPPGRCLYSSASLEARLTAGILPVNYLLC